MSDEGTKASAGNGRNGVAGIAWRGGTTFLGTKAALSVLGLSDEYATVAAAALAAFEITPDCIDWCRRTERCIRNFGGHHNLFYDETISRQSLKDDQSTDPAIPAAVPASA